MSNYFSLIICILFIILGINIPSVWANDCDFFTEIVPLVDEVLNSATEINFPERYSKELDCCYIDEITCDEQNNIVGIEFSSVKIKDLNAFFKGLGKLKNLSEIKMKNMYHSISDKPFDVGDIENLQHFVFTSNKYPNFFYNTVLGFMPLGLEKLKKLETLNLSNNSIKGKLSDYEYIFLMDSLKEMDLSNNDLEGKIPSKFKYMKNLESLDLSYNELEGYIPYDLEEMNNLHYFYVNDNEKLEGYGPLFKNLENCNYKNTGVCTLKGEKCHAPIQCYKLEIEDGNKNNGNPDPNANIDRAITDRSEREITPSGTCHNFNIMNPLIIGVIILFTLF